MRNFNYIDLLVTALLAAACGGEHDGTDGTSTGEVTTGVGPTSSAGETGAPTTGAAEPSGCVAATAGECEARAPAPGGENTACRWVRPYAPLLDSTACTIDQSPGYCDEVSLYASPAKFGQFKLTGDVLEVMFYQDYEVVADGWAYCFPEYDFEAPARPECDCFTNSYCARHSSSEADCLGASNSLQTCDFGISCAGGPNPS